ncbi:MAG: carboxypeptidase regulatory-like domain-containing protein, partial [Clostridia bacterium]|nr:carboxypeptidase regulatory-like domain-containing protein [Clostridia bacterium]
CGSDIGNADFCPNCGAKAEQAAPQAPVIPPAAVPVTESPATSPKTEKPKKKKGKGILIAVIAVIAAIAVLLTAFFFVLKPLLEKKEDNKTETPAEDPQATPALAIDYITISERDILISEPTEALVMVGISEGDYGELTIVSAGGKQFGTVNDNGENGDQRAKDGVYSGTVTFLSDTVVSMNIHACADAARSDRFETIYFYPPYQSEYYDEYESLASEIDNVYYQYSDMEQAHNAIMELLKSKKDNGLIRDYLFEAGSIRIKLNSGYTYVYSYNPGNAYKATATDDYSGDIQTEVGLYTISPNLNSVLTMQPYRHELGAGGVDSAANTIADSDYNFIFGTDVDNSDVSVELMKRLDQYNVILLDGHGGYNSIDHSFFGVGTIITAENDKLYHVDLIYGRLIKLSGGQYGVTAAFFERHYDEGDFSDAIVYLGCCHGADDSFLANTLLSKGVDAVYAYKNSVSVSYDTRMVKEVFEQLSSNTTNPVTVSQALTTAQSIHGVTDDYRAHWYNWLFNNYETVENRARLYLFGDTNMTLSMGDSYLRGWVADAETEAPIYNAYISASKVGTSIKSGNTSTGGSGYFKFKLEPGMYDITVLATGYLNCVVTNVRVEVNATTQLQNTIMLEKRNDNPVAVVGGQVIDAVTAEPVSGAQIVFREHYNQHSGDYVKDESGNVIT